jgi:hypothetical protein
MLPLLTFASGIVAGIVGVKLLKNAKTPQSLHDLGDKARGGLDKAGAGLRDVTVSGLSAIEKSTAGLRARLAPAEAEAEMVAEAPKPKKRTAAKKADAAAPAKPRRRTAKKAEPEAVAPAPEAEAQS